MPEPLPNNPYAAGTPTHQAYETCRALEVGPAPANWYGPPTVVCGRLLGYIIIHAPTEEGRTNITNEINSCEDNMSLHKLAKFYVDHFLRPFKQNKGRTPMLSTHVSRPSFDDTQEFIMMLLQEPPKSHTSAKRAALIRDGFRCMISGSVDRTSFLQNRDQLQALATAHGTSATECAHIFAPSTSQGISGDDEYGPKHNYAASAWAVMTHMGGILCHDELNGDQSHRLENILTMRADLHATFDSLGLWLEPTDVINQYEVHADAPLDAGIPAVVTFTAQGGLPLPDPRYLALHAACARVAHLSGAGEYIDAFHRDMETTLVLAKDGSSAKLLAEALSTVRPGRK